MHRQDEFWPEERWLDGLRAGDAAVFRAIYQRYSRPLLAIAYNKLRNKEVAEELVHDVLLRLWEKRLSIQVHTSLFAYLQGMLRNAVLMHIRSQPSVEVFVRRITAPEEPVANDTLEQIYFNDLSQRIDSCVDQLPTQCRQVYLLSRREFYSVDEIARQLNLSPQTVKNQLSKALSRLRQALGDTWPLLLLIWLNR